MAVGRRPGPLPRAHPKHEDEGMMLVTELTGVAGTLYTGAETLDPTCYRDAYGAPSAPPSPPSPPLPPPPPTALPSSSSRGTGSGS